MYTNVFKCQPKYSSHNATLLAAFTRYIVRASDELPQVLLRSETVP
jgi:hypothetical protein